MKTEEYIAKFLTLSTHNKTVHPEKIEEKESNIKLGKRTTISGWLSKKDQTELFNMAENEHMLKVYPNEGGYIAISSGTFNFQRAMPNGARSFKYEVLADVYDVTCGAEEAKKLLLSTAKQEGILEEEFGIVTISNTKELKERLGIDFTKICDECKAKYEFINCPR